MMKVLTKSKFQIGLQCLKYIWIVYNDPEKMPPYDLKTLALFAQGHRVGQVAQKLYPDGTLVDHADFNDGIKQTKDLLSAKKQIFEAGFLIDNLYARIDILIHFDGDSWGIIEVKSSTKVKDEHISDVAFQKYVCEKAGLKIARCLVAHIDNTYIRQGDIEPQKLIAVEDVSAIVDAYMDTIKQDIDEIFKTIPLKAVPEIAIGPHCNEPYECPLKSHCWAFLPSHSVFDMYYGGKKAFVWLDRGIQEIKDIPDLELNDKQKIQKRCVIGNDEYIDEKEMRDFLDQLTYPIYFLDFETINPGIPLFDNSRPYQRIPFQFSLDRVVKEGGDMEHFEFLAEGKEDPRPVFLKELRAKLGQSGSIVVYNQAFEQSVLKELARDFPEYAGWVEGVIERMVDLYAPFRSFHYYHPKQNGSASIKSVLPVMTGNGYEDLDIQEGDIASFHYYRITHTDEPILEEEKAKIRQQLIDYCAMDTVGMVKIVDKLHSLV